MKGQSMDVTFFTMYLINLFVDVAATHRLYVTGCGVLSPNVRCLDPWPVIPPGPLGKEGRVSVRGPEGHIHESQPLAGRFSSVKEAPLFASSAVALCCEHLPSVVSIFPSDTTDTTLALSTGPPLLNLPVCSLCCTLDHFLNAILRLHTWPLSCLLDFMIF